MYFLQQIRGQIFFTLRSYQVAVSEGPIGGAGNTEEDITAPDISQLSEEDRAKLGDLEELQKEIDVIQASEHIVKTQVLSFGSNLERIARGDEPGLSQDDPEYVELKAKYDRLIGVYEELVGEGQMINNIVRFRLNELDGVVGEQIEEIKVGESLDKTEKEYTENDIKEMLNEKETLNSNIRHIFFNFLGETDEGKSLSEYVDHEKVKILFQMSEEENLRIGYDLREVLERYDQVLSVGENNNIGRKLVGEIVGLSSVQTSLNIILRDVEIVDGEKTLREVRYTSGNEAYNEILQDEKLREALSSEDNSLPKYGDLTMQHIKILQDNDYDIRKLFLVDTKGKAFSGGDITEGDEYLINMGVNPDLDLDLTLSYLDFSIGRYEVDGQIVEFKSEGVLRPGYYKEGTNILVDIQDGSLIKTISERQEIPDEIYTEIETEIQNLISSDADRATVRQIYTESLYNNPNQAISGDTLPKGIFGSILAILMNILGGKNYVQDPETGEWRENIDGLSTQTYGEFREGFEGISLELGSLSKEFESGNRGPYAYVADDNGAGPSYGTYQMNRDKGVYREFAARYNIAPGQAGWNAKIEEVGESTFIEMEHNFIKEKNYEPMMNNITLPNKENFSATMKNVIWSSAVQHGPNKTVILNLINNSGVTSGDFTGEKELINKIYDARARLWPAGANTRYRKERSMALSSLSMEKNRGKQFNSASEALAAYEGRDVSQSIRDLGALESGFRSKVESWLQDIKNTGIRIVITETLRTQSRQDYLFAQGRTRPGAQITWTQNSNHKGGNAMDIAFDPRVYGSSYPPVNGEPWVTVARLAKENGIDWGQDLWGKDAAHFQDSSLRG